MEEFSTQLLQEYGVTVRESRGRFSYLTAGRTKPISSRKLGDDFSKEKVLAVLAENAERKKTARLYSSDPHPDRISRLIDIQAKLAAGKGAGYEHWAKIFNLKQLAKSMVLFTRYNLNSEKELDARVKELAEKYDEAHKVVKDLENRIKANRELSRHVTAYLQNRKYAQQVKTAKDPEAFREQHRAELTVYQAAAAYFKAQKITKLPSLKQLEAEREQLISEKAQFYEAYREAKKAWIELSSAQQNLLSTLHREDRQQEEDQLWIDSKGKIVESAFCAYFLQKRPLMCLDQKLFDLDGEVNEERLRHEIHQEIRLAARNDTAKKTKRIVDAIKMECYREEWDTQLDRIHLKNGTYYLDERALFLKRNSASIASRWSISRTPRRRKPGWVF